MHRDRLVLGLILAAIFGALATRLDQPIVENYVGRQVPTAMVARNLERGSGFLHPTLDTAPFPNRFLVEPPIYPQLVAWVRSGIGFVWGISVEPSVGFVWEIPGRLTSATLTTLGAWSFFGLVRRREGPTAALVSLASFGMFPVILRYGRAFQPDAAMLGFVLLGMRGWDEYQAEGRRRWAWMGGLALTVGLAIKITSAWILIPFALVVTRLPLVLRLGVGLAMVLPAIGWYLHAWNELSSGSPAAGSLASADNAAIWIKTLSPESWLRFATWEAVAWNFSIRAFTPVGFALAVAGWCCVASQPEGDRLWRGWAIGSGLAIVVLAAKWHHGYYWMVMAPLVAVGVARTLVTIGRRDVWGQVVAWGLGSFFLLMSGYQSAPTWRDPPEWRSIQESGSRILLQLGRIRPLIAPEAVLYYSDVPGYRLEFSPEAVRRASGEFGDPIPVEQATSDPMALVNFYASCHNPGDFEARFGSPVGSNRGGVPPRFVADIGSVAGDSRRIAWRAALRVRPRTRILVDEPDLILAELEGEGL